MRRTVQTLERRGANAIQLEDQTFPKRCGHFAGKEVIPAAEMVAKLHAALDARDDDALLIIARTDARQMLGLDAALERAELYREAGADVIFVEAPESGDELAEIGRRLDGPLLVNIVEGGATPQLPADELGALGLRHRPLRQRCAARRHARDAAGARAPQAHRLDARARWSRWSGGSSARSSSASRSSTS